MKNTSDLEDKLRKYGKKHILIVDTKKNYHLEKILNEVGYSTTMATSEKEALQTFFDNPFDIILSEIFLGNGDFSVETFYDLIPKLNLIDEKALFMGMTNENKNISRMGDKDIISSSHTIDEYLGRPFDRKEFYQKIKTLIKKRDEEILDNQVRFMARLDNWQNYGTEETRTRLTHFVNYLHDRVSSNSGIVHPIFATDCATGIITDMNPNRTYGRIREVGTENEYANQKNFEMGHRAYYIKKFEDTSEVTQHREDLKLFSNYNKLNEGNEFKLPKLIFSCPSIPKNRRESLEKLVDNEDNPLISLPSRHRQAVCEITIGPTIGYVFKKLNEQKNAVALSNKQRNWYTKIVDSIMEINLNELNTWQKNTGIINGGTEKFIKNKLISSYKENLVNAIIDFNHYTIRKDTDPNKLTKQEIDNFKESLSLFDNLTNRDIDLFSRNLDNSPGNSGWDMRKVNVGIKELLYHFGLKKHDQYSGVLAQINKNVKKKIQSKFAHWDQAFKNSHILEDVFHIIDSYDANIGKTPHESWGKRIYHHTTFMKGVGDRLNNFDYKDSKFWLDFLLMGYYRNLRKRHLFITKYAARNEELFKHHKIDKQTYGNKVQEQKRQMIHYGEMAKQYAFIGCDFFKKKRKNSFSKNRSTIYRLSIPSLNNKGLEKEFDIGGELEGRTTNLMKGNALSVKAKLNFMDSLIDSDSKEDKETSNYFKNLYDVASKITKSNDITLHKLNT